MKIQFYILISILLLLQPQGATRKLLTVGENHLQKPPYVTSFADACIDSTDDQDIPGQRLLEYSINSRIPLFRFRLFGDSALTEIHRIEVLSGTDSSVLQVIKCDLHDPPFLTPEDANFDGFQDLKLWCDHGAHGNTEMKFWLFDSSTFRFAYCRELSELVSPGFDPNQRVVTSDWVGGMYDYSSSTYQFINGRLTEISATVQTSDFGTQLVTKTTKRIRNGTLEVVSKEVFKMSN